MSGKDIRIDAYEAGSWNGIVFIADDSAAFQVRVGSLYRGNLIDGDQGREHADSTDDAAAVLQATKLFDAVNEVGPHAPDSSYCRLGWNPDYPLDGGSKIILEWSKIEPGIVLAKVTFDGAYNPMNYVDGNPGCDIILEAYCPRTFCGDFNLCDGGIEAQASFYPVVHEIEWYEWRFTHSTSRPDFDPTAEPGFQKGYFKHGHDDAAWQTVQSGAYWQEHPGIDSNGYGWYRNEFIIPQEHEGEVIEVDLWKVSSEDWTYLNGQLIGTRQGREERRKYRVQPNDPAYGAVNWGGRNVVAVQVRNHDGLGGISSGEVHPGMRAGPPRRPRIRVTGHHEEVRRFCLVASKSSDYAGQYGNLSELREDIKRNVRLSNTTGERCAGLQFCDLHIESKYQERENALFFVAGVGDDREALRSSCRAIAERGDVDATIEEAKERYRLNRVTVTGSLKGSAEIVTNNLHWSTVYSPEQRSGVVIDARSWCLPDHWTLFANSGVMCALAASLENKNAAVETLQGVLAEQLFDGRVMNVAGSGATSPDRSEDMYAAYCAWKIYRRFGDIEILKQIYPRLKKWHLWWFADRGDGQPWRDGNKDGFLEIGSDAMPPDTPQDPDTCDRYWKLAQFAFWESGYDDSPMWGSSYHPPQDSEAKYIYRTNTINLNLVCRNTLYALNAECLAMIARELCFDRDCGYFQRDYEQMKEKINAYFWDDGTGMYLNRFWEEYGGKFSYRKSPTMFFPLAAGIPSGAQAERLVREHLLNEAEFWGDYILPSISRDDPAFAGQYYWRGAVWPPMNLFTYEGLKRYGFDDVAAELATKTHRMILREWEQGNYLWENYNSLTGEGDPKGRGNSTKHYSWSACFAYMVLMEFLDEEAWAGLRFGSIGVNEESTVQNLRAGGHTYDVTIGKERTRIVRDKTEIISATTALIVRNFQRDEGNVCFDVKTRTDVSTYSLTVGGFGRNGLGKVNVLLNHKKHKIEQMGDDTVTVIVPGGEHHLSLS